jgi:hypothetical protein
MIKASEKYNCNYIQLSDDLNQTLEMAVAKLEPPIHGHLGVV